MIDSLRKKFEELYGQSPLTYRSPGRVNLIGEHTDYNEGFVLPAAIDKQVVFALNPNQSNRCHFYAIDLDQSFTTDLDKLEKSSQGWPDYLMGVIDQFQQIGKKVSGFNCAFGGNIPLGAGLSSSAAIECALAFALNDLFGFGLEKFDLVKLAQKAENEFVGVKCGIMDQFASMFGQPNQVIKLDCRSLEYAYYDFDMSDYLIVLCDTQVKHSLASSEYNTRRHECEKGVSIISKDHPDIKSLRDISLDQLKQYQAKIDPVVFKRCQYVIQENQRVEQACNFLNEADLNGFGAKMYESHQGLQNDYEVSCMELDFLVEKTRNMPQVIGARMMGGGFGGCTINLMLKDHVPVFTREMTDLYKKELNLDLKVYVDSIAPGTSRM